jgi:phosphoglycerate kinase
MTFRTLDTADLAGKTALVRVDFNVPVEGARSPTTPACARPADHPLPVVSKGAKVILLAHFDRPKGKVVPEMSLKPSWPGRCRGCWSSRCLRRRTASAPKPKRRSTAWRTAAWRCWRTSASTPARKRTTPTSPTSPGRLGDIYVNDAFSAPTAPTPRPRAWRKLLPAYPGLSMQRELEALDAALGNPKKPVIGIVGGSKVSTKLDLLKNLVAKLDKLAIGGGMANTFLFAQGHDVGGSLCEKDMADTAREIIAKAGQAGLRTAAAARRRGGQEVAPGAETAPCAAWAKSHADDLILDAGPETVERLQAAMDPPGP